MSGRFDLGCQEHAQADDGEQAGERPRVPAARLRHETPQEQQKRRLEAENFRVRTEKLRAEHAFWLFGLPFLVLHYRMNRKGGGGDL